MTGPARHALRIGLTGPIGCGKSTVRRWLAELDGVIGIDADQLARDVLDPGTDEVEAVYRRFGASFRGADGALDRGALAAIVFADPGALADLEAIVHPAVRRRILAALEDADRSDARAVIVEAIKLVEGGLATLCDEVWLITCPEATQTERALERGMGPGDIVARVATQRDLVDRAGAVASVVVDTDEDPDMTRRRVTERLEAALSRTA